MRLYNTLGVLLRQVHFNAPQQDMRVNISGLAQGLYFVKLDDGITTVRKKLVVAR